MADTSPQRVWNPQERLVLQMPATEEHKAGRVLTFGRGWINIGDDPALQNHPLLSKLQGELPGSASRQEKLAQADEEYAKAIAEAETRRAEVRAQIQQEEMDERQDLATDYSERQARAAERGETFSEMHPDPETRRAHALTSTTANMVSAASLTQRPQGIEEPKKTREALPSEGEAQGLEAQANKGDGGHAQRAQVRPRGRGVPGSASGIASSGAAAPNPASGEGKDGEGKE